MRPLDISGPSRYSGCMRIFVCLALSLVVLAGCFPKPGLDSSKEQPGVAMGDEAQAFANDWSKFIVGRWSPKSGMTISPEMAKQMGMESVNTGGEVDTDRWWRFNEDGTFAYQTRAFDWKVEGKWTLAADGISLQYLTFDGLPMDQAREKVQKRAETGRQGALLNDMATEDIFTKLPNLNRLMLDEDKKHIYFVTGSGAPDPAMGELGGMGRMLLERVK